MNIQINDFYGIDIHDNSYIVNIHFFQQGGIFIFIAKVLCCLCKTSLICYFVCLSTN